jgi:hypothetical protein
MNLHLKILFLSFISYSLAATPFVRLNTGTAADSNRSSLLIISAGYRMPLTKSKIISSGHGLYIEAGINPAFLVSEKALAGIYGGWAAKDDLWHTSFSNDIILDYNNSITGHQLKGFDSVVVHSSAELIATSKGRSGLAPGCETRSFHTSSLYYGIIIGIRIRSYPMALKLYSGLTKTLIKKNNVITEDPEFNYLAFQRRMFGVEFIAYPGMKSKAIKDLKDFRLGCVSFYYEYTRFSGGALQYNDSKHSLHIPFDTFLNTAFLKKYNSEVTGGIKLSVALR